MFRSTGRFRPFLHNFSTCLGQPGLSLEDLFVPPEHRGRGPGKALLTHLAKIAHARGCGRFEGSVLDGNEDAIGFCRKAGAVPISDWTVFRLSGDTLTRRATSNHAEEAQRPPANHAKRREFRNGTKKHTKHTKTERLVPSFCVFRVFRGEPFPLRFVEIRVDSRVNSLRANAVRRAIPALEKKLPGRVPLHDRAFAF